VQVSYQPVFPDLYVRVGRECGGEEPSCDPGNPFRTISGACNNLRNPKWGMATTKQVRIVPNEYDDSKYISTFCWIAVAVPGFDLYGGGGGGVNFVNGGEGRCRK